MVEFRLERRAYVHKPASFLLLMAVRIAARQTQSIFPHFSSSKALGADTFTRTRITVLSVGSDSPKKLAQSGNQDFPESLYNGHINLIISI